MARMSCGSALLLVLLVGLAHSSWREHALAAGRSTAAPATRPAADARPARGAASIAAAAREQVGKTLAYDSAYTRLAYPGGDVPIQKGVCTDVVIRALRTALHLDLQQLVNEDMRTAFAQYPRQWGLSGPDRNIDHRRVPNLMCYFRRQGWSLPVTRKSEDYAAGDLVTCTVAGKLPHIMVVSDRKAADGTPLVIHNIGHGTQEEDRLFEFPLTGHYRVKTDMSQPSAARNPTASQR